MKRATKKGLIVGLSFFAFIIAFLTALPFVFHERILKLAKEQVNDLVDAKVDFEDVNVSFLRNFPKASIQLENLKIVGVGEFENDTLLFSKDVDLVVDITSLFGNTDGYLVRKLQFNDARILAHVLPNGKTNWDIMKKDTSALAETDTAAMHFNLKLKDFVISNANIVYWDEEGNMKAVINNLNHHTSGDLTADSSLLVTKSTIDSLSFWMDNVEYISKADVEMNADINANLNKMLFTFSKNDSRLNAIPFSFEGWFKMLDEGYDMDLTLNADKVDFKAILSMIPAIYTNSFEGLKAGGDVDLRGFIKGQMVGDFYPAFDFKLLATKGWFQYPELPKSLENINIEGHITNPGKTLDETVVDISKFSFVMGGNPFSAQMHVAYPMSDPELMLKAIGKIDFGMIKDIYPLDADMKLSGILDMNLDLGGRMSYYENNQYDKFKFAGKLNITNMLLHMKSFPQDVSISQANMIFNNRYAELLALKMKIGRNDLAATGKLENFVAYALQNKTLTGSLMMQSNYFNVSDFMSATEPTAATTTKEKAATPADTSKLSVIVIPKNIDFTMQAAFKQLVYDKMNFTNATGTLKIVGGEMKIQNMGVQAFGGNLLVNGLYSTAIPEKPSVNFTMTINEVVFSEVAKQVDMVQKFVPIFSKATGKFSTNLTFSSLLQKDMMPDLKSFIGNGNFSTKSVGITDVPALTALASTLKRSDLSNSTIKDLMLLFDIKDGNLITKPFNLKMGDLKMSLGGTTGLDKSIAYVGNVQLPAKLNVAQMSTVNFKIGGTFTKPKIELDLANTLNTLLKDNKAKVEAEVNKQVDNAKAKITEEARIQKEKALKAAEVEAEKIKAEAKKLGDEMVLEAQKKGDLMVSKATNPITKKVAETASKKLVDEAKKKAADLNTKADAEAQKRLQQAADATK